MLLLTRKQNEGFLIEIDGVDEPIRVKVLDINNQVRFGIDAPVKCKIWREELYQTIKENNKAVLKNVSAKNIKDIAKKISKNK